MSELGRRSGEARRRPDPERVHPGLREYLRREVPPEQIWAALRAAMEGENKAAAVSASRVLVDALSEGRDVCARCAANDAIDKVEVRRKVDRLIEVEVEAGVEERTKELQEQLRALRGVLRGREFG